VVVKVHSGLHDAVQLIDGIVSPSATVYIVVGGDSLTDSGPSKRNRNSAILFN
jgi:actin-related protein